MGTDPAASHTAFDLYFMRQALRQAVLAAEAGETPTGCLIVAAPEHSGGLPAAARVLARSRNQTEQLRDPTAHAEMIAITQAAAAMGDWRLNGAWLYVTKEPCPMCAGAIVLARLDRVVFGVSDPRRGGISVFNLLDHAGLNHRAAWTGGVLAADCRALLQSFFKARRDVRLRPPGRDGHSDARPPALPGSGSTAPGC